LRIEFLSELPEFQLNSEDLIRNWIENCIQNENKILGEIVFIFVSKKTILSINQTYLHHNYLTDIITFNNSFLSNISGEVYICIPIVKENAALHSNNLLSEELCRIIIHGVLHLLGYNDLSEFDISTMRSLENFYLDRINI
jgi:probable rRNA maturation factor